MNKTDWLNKIKSASRVDKFSKIIELCSNKRVLDVGCVGQDKSYENPNWLHGRIKKVATDLTGVDIDKEGIDVLNNNGFSVLHMDDMNSESQKFDLIIMGDVIEHVNDPGQFLEFYSKFLSDNGQMVICTPNAFGVRYLIQVLFYGIPGTNEEHTMTFDPYVMLELFSRVNIQPKEFYWLKEYRSASNWKQSIIYALSNFFIFFRKFFNSNFMYIVGKK